MATDDYKHDGQVTITLAYDADEISVWPSVEVAGGVTIALLDSQEPRTNVGIASPDEWDAFVAAGNAALGRPTPTSTPLESRLLSAIEAADEHTEKGWSLGVEAEDIAAAKGRTDGLRAALAMVREQGATVPRAGVVDAFAPVLTIHAQIAEESGEERTNAIEALLTALDEARATIEAAGLWPVAAPATTALRGELLMSGQTEAIDALDRLAKGGER
jgi:hypothetical protein